MLNISPDRRVRNSRFIWGVWLRAMLILIIATIMIHGFERHPFGPIFWSAVSIDLIWFTYRIYVKGLPR